MGNVIVLLLNVIVVAACWEIALSDYHLEPDDAVFKVISVIGACFFPIFEWFNPVTDSFMFWMFDGCSVGAGLMLATGIIQIMDYVLPEEDSKMGQIIPYPKALDQKKKSS